MDDQKAAPVVKKVRPYPFDANLEAGALKKPVEVLQINLIGAIVRLKGPLIFVGEFYMFNFELPVVKDLIGVKVRVLKTYDRVLNKDADVERMAEVHFQNITSEHKSRIHAFLSAIKQEQ